MALSPQRGDKQIKQLLWVLREHGQGQPSTIPGRRKGSGPGEGGMLQELQVGDRNASLPMPRIHTWHKLTGLRNPSPYAASMVCRSLYHPDLSSRLPPANPVLLSEQVKYPPASGPQHLLFSQIKNSPSNAASLCSNVTLTEKPSHRTFINGNPTHSSGP